MFTKYVSRMKRALLQEMTETIKSIRRKRAKTRLTLTRRWFSRKDVDCIIAKSVATGSTRTACYSIVNRLTKIRDFPRDIRSSSDQSSTSTILICISMERIASVLNCALNALNLRSAILNLLYYKCENKIQKFV